MIVVRNHTDMRHRPLSGLSARVIRVWFQNKRCKDKKKAIAAASGDDVISSSVADSPSDDKLKVGMVSSLAFSC